MRGLSATPATLLLAAGYFSAPGAWSLLITGGEKGGVGKSRVSRLLALHFIDRGIACTGLRTDKLWLGYVTPEFIVAGV